MIRVCFESKEVEQVSLSLQLSTVQEERLERDFNMTAALRKKSLTCPRWPEQLQHVNIGTHANTTMCVCAIVWSGLLVITDHLDLFLLLFLS